MKTTLFGAIGGAAVVTLLLVLSGHERTVLAQRPNSFESGSDLIPVTATVDSGRQQITIIDPTRRVLSVYHIELASGVITLKSVRNINGDLQIDEFNGKDPLPRDIRQQLQQR